MNTVAYTNHETKEVQIPEQTIEAFARSFFKEASTYGFGTLDYVRFVNQLLEFSMNKRDLAGPLANNSSDARVAERMHDAVCGIQGPCPSRLPIEGRRVKITSFETGNHLALIKRWLPDRYGRHFLLSCTTSKTLNLEELVTDKSNIFGMIALRDETPIGSVAFLDFDPVQRKAELRKLIGEPNMRGKGFAKEATRLWIDYGTRVLGLKKIYVNTLNTNIRNIRLNEELGFKFEGILRNDVLVDNEYHDVLRMAIWNE
jgi:RimJ/RimL family protein N-acetyltransferase